MEAKPKTFHSMNHQLDDDGAVILRGLPGGAARKSPFSLKMPVKRVHTAVRVPGVIASLVRLDGTKSDMHSHSVGQPERS